MIPLLYLLRCRIVNSVRRAIKQPRLLLPAILFAIVAVLQLTLFLTTDHSHAGDQIFYASNNMLQGKPAAFLLTMRGLLLVSIFTGFITALGEGTAFFEPGDIDNLFPAPLSRRSVLFFKMLGRYASLLLPSAYLPITFAGGFLPGEPLQIARFVPGIIGSWLFLVAVSNLTQIALLRSAPHDDPNFDQRERWRVWLRQALYGLLIVGGIGIFLRGFTVFEYLRLSQWMIESGFWSHATPDAWAADLFRVLFDGYRATDSWRLFGLLAFCCLSFLLLFWRERDFYESSMELSVRGARLSEAVKSGDIGAVLTVMAQEGKLARGRTLPDFGGGARAILWKDLVAATRIPMRNWLQLLIPAAFPAILGGVFGRESGYSVLGWIILYSLQMPSIFLLTLRDVVRRADISKALPLSPLKLFGGELILPLIQLTGLGWLSLGMIWLAGFWRGPLLLVAMLVLPSLAALLFLVQAIFVLIYPNPNDPAQHAVSGVISLGVSLVALIPPLSIGIPLYMLGVSVGTLALAVSVINIVFALIALLIASILWQRFDPTN